MAGALNENFSKSDHRPITVNCQFYENVEERTAGGRKMFEAKWLLEENFDDIVSTAWNRAQLEGPRNIAQKLNEVHRSLHAWDMQTLKEPHRHSRELQEKLNSVMEGPLSDEATSQQQRIQLSIEQILEQEELKWVQRSRANWMKSGDRNTHFFHNFATGRKKRNLIKKLSDANNNMVEGWDYLADHINDYFRILFSVEVPDPNEEVISKVKPCVTTEMNEALCAPYTREEVKKALFNIGDLKAPGPDGLHAIFFKKYWSLVGEELTDEVLAAVNSGTIPDGWNDTTIVLIPKVDFPEKVTEYRSISLCNVTYKVV
jgi:hypothetical protein